MIELTEEQRDALVKIIAKRAEEKAKEDVIQLDKDLDIVVGKLSPEGWTLPAQLGIYAVKTFAQTNELDDVNAFLQSYFSYDNYFHTKNMIASIMDSSIRQGLKKLTEECWNAFQGKQYAICATSLLSVIEGILSEFSEDKQDIRMMKVCQKKVDTFPEGGSTIKKHTWISYNHFIRNLYQKSDFTAEEPDKINRHWLLHGRSDFEIDELDCIRLFNAVESLCMIINSEKKELSISEESN